MIRAFHHALLRIRKKRIDSAVFAVKVQLRYL